jgi:hypothetical protein
LVFFLWFLFGSFSACILFWGLVSEKNKNPKAEHHNGKLFFIHLRL